MFGQKYQLTILSKAVFEAAITGLTGHGVAQMGDVLEKVMAYSA
jgi:hypothetical protein